jgi:hypothetical protein
MLILIKNKIMPIDPNILNIESNVDYKKLDVKKVYIQYI